MYGFGKVASLEEVGKKLWMDAIIKEFHNEG
jgi:hypothetical protein